MRLMFYLTTILLHILLNVNTNEGKRVKINWPSWQKGGCEVTPECLYSYKHAREFQNNNNRVKIQTDKCVYRSGENINFRVLFMDKDLKPIVPKKSAVIWHQTAPYLSIHKQKNFNVIDGVYADAIDIPDNADTRYWQLGVGNGEGDEKRVCLKIENIAANYKVKLEATESVSIRDGEINVVVTANHVSGTPLDGKATVNLYIGGSDGRSVLTKPFNMIKGKGSVMLNVKEFARHITNKRYPTNVNIKVTVVEQSSRDKIIVNAVSYVDPSPK